ncbi:MAG: M20 family metallo-hydrolase [Treponema sp.]|jgi:succinyl-diaminopimelate desuccinylase|nr:M20 family metallo-hydrolase [Treponema sp.]
MEEKKKLFTYIDNAAVLIKELETELTRRPAIAPDSGGEGELDKCVFLEDWLTRKGITHLERYDAPDSRAKGGARPNLVATIAGKDDSKRVWIMSHLDVVPPGEAALWDSDPWTVIERDGKLIGRGVEDNQQGLCSSVVAALALLNAGITPPYTVKLLFVADEEVGSHYGIHWLLEQHNNLFNKDDMILVPDGGDAKGETIEIAEKNLLWARFITKGAQTHGSRPDQGINAFLAGADLAVSLHEELSCAFPAHDPLFEPDYSTFQPTKKEANVPNINTIPGEDVFCMDMRILPCYPLKTVRAEIDRIKARIEAKHGVSITYTTPQSMESQPTPPDADLVIRLSMAVKEVYGVATRPIGIGGGTVAAPLRNVGIAAVVWARIGESAHQPNEYALISSIMGDAKIMALLMLGV